MKKQFLLLAGAAVILASCGSNEPKQEGPTQAQIDSTVAAQVAAHDAENAARNDSALKAMEAEKAAAAAAIEEETKTKTKTTSTKTKTKTTTTKTETPPPPPPPPAGGMRGHADQATPTPAGKSGGGMRGHADQK
jgi:cytoskeletal protein RodZ